MSADAELRCRCETVRGRVRNASPDTTNRVVCYCDDCQAFLHHLGRAELLDPNGGSDVVQVAPSALTFHEGVDRIACVRLSPKGLFRFYASCCKTPIGNTMNPSIPFVGIVAKNFEVEGRHPDETFGKPRGGVQSKFAIGTPTHPTNRDVRLLAGAVVKVLGWRFSGRTWPHPFFERGQSAPRFTVSVLSSADREALRAHCGPAPTIRSS